MIFDFLKIEKNSNKEFWLSHLFIIIATVIGVYLAAISGFTQAIKFENAVSQKNTYYLQKSMLDELEDNIKYIDNIGNKYLDGFVYYKKQDEALDTFIWDSMKFASETFEVRGEVLSSIRRYYSKANAMILRITKKQKNAIDKKFVQKVLAMSVNLKQKIIPQINKDLKTLRDKSINSGIEL